jgi:hypothetical protein
MLVACPCVPDIIQRRNSVTNQMWPWPSKSCPLDPTTRAWLDKRWRWLTEEFGDSVLLESPHVFPTSDWFPEPYDSTDEAAEIMGRRVCGYMIVPADLVDFEFYSDRSLRGLVDSRGYAVGGVAGTFEDGTRFRIRIERSQLLEPMTLAGTLAHELSHARLLGGNHIDPDCFDHELTTDLNVVFHGMGIFLANAPRHWDADTRRWPGTDQPAPTYMTGAMLGYALALRCCQRMEPLPAWRKYINPGVRAEFKQSYRFLDR